MDPAQVKTKAPTATIVVNCITLYRVITAPVLLILLIAGFISVFKWMLLASFFTDAIDGFIARKFKAVSSFGARLDSLGDDLTVAVAAIGVAVTRPHFIYEQRLIIAILLGLFSLQVALALLRYGKMSSFHTYVAKAAAVLQGLFLLSTFFVDDLIYPLYYSACIITALGLIEEVILVALLPEWKNDVKGIYWAKKQSKT